MSTGFGESGYGEGGYGGTTAATTYSYTGALALGMAIAATYSKVTSTGWSERNAASTTWSERAEAAASTTWFERAEAVAV